MQYNGSRIAFHLFGIPVYWYAILMITGMIIAIWGASNELKRQGKDPDIIVDLAMWILPIGIIGARIWYVIFEWDQYKGDLLAMINIRQGGLAIQGGVIFGAIVGYIYCRVKKLKFLEIGDPIFIFLPLAQAIGRWGNFINNEAHGGPTDLPWGLIIDGQKYHPTFLYESLGNVLIFAFLFYFYRKRKTINGQIICLYLILYGILRFFVEGLRTDSLYVGPFRTAQLIAIAGVIIGSIGLYLLGKRKNKIVD